MPQYPRARGARLHVDGRLTCTLAALAAAGLLSALVDATLGWSWIAGAAVSQLMP